MQPATICASHVPRDNLLRMLCLAKSYLHFQDGDFPIHNAAYGGEVETLQALLDGKADVQAQDEVGYTAIKNVH